MKWACGGPWGDKAMTFMTLTEAKAACQPEFDLYTEAQKTMKKAYKALEAARAAYDSAGGALDDSTFWDITALATVAASCLIPEPFSKSLCIAGFVGGGAAVTASELDRKDEIDAAKQALKSAEAQYEMAATQASALGLKYFDCLFHHVSKGS
jgi:hypothetical protein